MPFRTWVFAIALGLIFAPSLGQSQDQTQYPEWQTEPQLGPSQSLPLPFPIYVVEDESTAETRQREQDESRQREIEDLIAQQEMNIATQAMNAATQDMRDYALYSTTLIGVGTLLLFVTLFLTWQANWAAQEAVKVTRRIGEAQTRAYLSFDSIEAIFVKPGGGACTAIRFRPYIKNTGQTPAHIRVTHSTVECFDVKPSKIEVTPINTPANIRVGSQKAIFLGSGVMEWESVKNALDRDLHVILKCGVEFEDVFYQPGDERRVEDFAVRIIFNGPLTDPSKPLSELPSVEWNDLQIEIARIKPAQGGDDG